MKNLSHKFSSNQNQLTDTSDVYYFKLPYIDNLSHHIKNKLSKLCKEFCKENFNIKLAFNSFKIKSYFSYKDPIPNDLKSFLVNKSTCASCSSSYIGKTCCHFKSRIEKHIKKDNKSHIFKHLQSTTRCFDSYNSLSFRIIDKANSEFDLKVKEALHIRTKPKKLTPPLCFFLSLFFLFFFSSFFCLNYTLLLLRLITTHLVSHLFLSSIIFIVSDTNYRHLLLS